MNALAALFITVAQISASLTAQGEKPEALFAETHLAPADVWMYVHIEDVHRLRDDLERLPISEWGQTFLQGGQMIQTWSSLTALAGANKTGLLDMMVGNELTFMVRNSGADTQWVILTDIEQDKAELLLKRLKPRILRSQRDASFYRIPEHDLMLALSTDGILGICQFQQSQLLMKVIGRMEGQKGRSLADNEAIQKVARKLGPGQVGVYIKHDRPWGGWSVATLNFEGQQLKIQHRAKFDEEDYSQPTTKKTIDVALLENFRHLSSLTIMEPTDIPQAMWGSFFTQLLGREPLFNEELKKSIGDVRILTVGNIEGQLQRFKTDLHLPTFAMCVELNDSDIPESAIDKRLLRIARRLNHIGQGKFLLDIPKYESFIPGEPRTINLDPLTAYLGGDLPYMHNIDLCWQTTESVNGNYLVIATHEQLLRDSVEALQKEITCPSRRGKWVSCGIANGTRIGHHLQSFSHQAPLIAKLGQVDEFVNTLQMMSKLAFGINVAGWRLQRPCPSEIFLEVEIELAPPVSSDRQ